jgi:hypothetical protein
VELFCFVFLISITPGVLVARAFLSCSCLAINGLSFFLNDRGTIPRTAAEVNAAKNTSGEHNSATDFLSLLCLLRLNYPSEEGKKRRVADGILYLDGPTVKENQQGNVNFLSAYFCTYVQKHGENGRKARSWNKKICRVRKAG